MQILHVITTIDRGGAENQLLLLARMQVRAGNEVSVLPLKGNSELSKLFAGYGVHVVSSLTNTSPLNQMLQLRKLSKNFNLIHAHLPRAEIISSIACSRNLVLSRHNCETFIPNRSGILSTLLSRYVASRANVVIAISETVKKFLLKNKEVPTKKIRVVKYGFDIEPKNSRKLSTKYSEDEILIGTIARLVPQKDLMTLLRAFKLVSREIPNAKLKIIGSGYLLSELKQASIDLNIADRVEWLGKVDSPLEHIKAMEVFVMTSLYEGFGLVVLEAMSQKVPVILSANDSFCELFSLLEDNFFPIGNFETLAIKITAIISGKNKQKILVRQKEILQSYSAVKMFNEIFEVYQEVISVNK